MAVSGWPHHY